MTTFCPNQFPEIFTLCINISIAKAAEEDKEWPSIRQCLLVGVVTANELVVIGESPRILILGSCVSSSQHPVYVDRAEAMLNSWYGGRGECLRNVRIMSPFERN